MLVVFIDRGTARRKTAAFNPISEALEEYLRVFELYKNNLVPVEILQDQEKKYKSLVEMYQWRVG